MNSNKIKKYDPLARCRFPKGLVPRTNFLQSSLGHSLPTVWWVYSSALVQRDSSSFVKACYSNVRT